MAGSAYIVWFHQVGLKDREQVGGKGGSLGELSQARIDVPAGFIVTTSAFERYLSTLERNASVRAAVAALDPDNLEAVTACSQALRARVEVAELADDLLAPLYAAHQQLLGGDTQRPVAVRSSATTEDASEASFAGLQDTYLWVKGAAEVARCVRSCWASLYSVESISYRLKHRIPEESVAMAVVVQLMVDARTAGVMFTRSPTTGDRSVVTIEGAWGLGSSVVGGEVTPDRWVLGKITGEISVRNIADKATQHVPRAGGGVEAVAVDAQLRCLPCLSDAELEALRAVARRVERHYGRAQDIEWAIDRSGALLLLQSRPETVWSVREAAPVAAPQADPSLHVMAIFGGRK